MDRTGVVLVEPATQAPRSYCENINPSEYQNERLVELKEISCAASASALHTTRTL